MSTTEEILGMILQQMEVVGRGTERDEMYSAANKSDLDYIWSQHLARSESNDNTLFPCALSGLVPGPPRL